MDYVIALLLVALIVVCLDIAHSVRNKPKQGQTEVKPVVTDEVALANKKKAAGINEAYANMMTFGKRGDAVGKSDR